ncbi:MAG: hypothetical protein WBO36_07870, partial [Saprospiraceae bacterium]
RYGKRVEATDTIQKMDMVKLEAEELDGAVVKEDGWKTEFSVLVDVIHDPKVKEEIQTLKLGDTITFDIYPLEDKDAAHINKYILKKPEDSEQEIGNMFVAKIIEVSRIEPAEFNEEFFEVFGSDDVTDEASLREFIKNDIKKYYDQQADQFMSRDIMDRLMEINQVDLPVDFLKRYIKENNQNVTEEVVEQEFDDFAKNLRWSLKKSALAKTHDITVNDEDIRNHFTNSVLSYMRSYGNMDYSFITQTVDRLMKDKEQVNKAYEEVLADRIFSAIGNTVQKNKVSISIEDFAIKVKALNEKAKISNE